MFPAAAAAIFAARSSALRLVLGWILLGRGLGLGLSTADIDSPCASGLFVVSDVTELAEAETEEEEIEGRPPMDGRRGAPAVDARETVEGFETELVDADSPMFVCEPMLERGRCPCGVLPSELKDA